ncbi:MAG: hypothetical protein J7L47_07885 [Candidatus Odinarchaeota archaeon]|nr:hypothetical protein [Candidatus Odinarchaeota archaeon]RKY70231.1 MAG: hypothetical protein DRQ24_09620 [Candidatus Latescibacterota bacterium]
MAPFLDSDTSGYKQSITLSTSTLRVYLYILEKFNDRVSVKAIQNGLNFSSSSTAHFHLRKLVEYGLLDENRGIYYIRRTKKVDFVTNFVRIKNKLIPKDAFYFGLVLIASVLGIYYFCLKHVGLLDLFVFLAPSTIAALFFIKNTIDLVSMKRRILEGATKTE